MWTLLDLHKHSLRGRRIPLHSLSLLLKLCKWRRKLLLVKPFFLMSVFYFFTSFCRTLSFFMHFLPLCSYLCMIGVKIFNSSCISFAFFFFFFNCVSLAYFRCVSVFVLHILCLYALFVLTSNWFRKWFSGKVGVWLLLQIWSNWKVFPVDRKI